MKSLAILGPLIPPLLLLPMIDVICTGLTHLVAVSHFYFGYLESFGWRRGAARSFGISREAIPITQTLAANQGFYNIILASLLLYSYYSNNLSMLVLLLSSIFYCGLIGSLTAAGKIFFLQALPAAINLGLLVGKIHTHLLDNQHILGFLTGAVLTIIFSLGINAVNKRPLPEKKK